MSDNLNQSQSGGETRRVSAPNIPPLPPTQNNTRVPNYNPTTRTQGGLGYGPQIVHGNRPGGGPWKWIALILIVVIVLSIISFLIITNIDRITGAFDKEEKVEAVDSVAVDSVVVDSVVPVAPVPVKPEVKEEKKAETKKETSKAEKDDYSYREEEEKPVQAKKTNGSVSLGYGTWTGGISAGKPDGRGTLTFTSSRNFHGASVEPGYTLRGTYVGGQLVSGKLYDTSGSLVRTIVP